MTIFPAGSIRSDRTRAFGPVPSALKPVSIEPFGFNRAMPLSATPLTVVKSPLNRMRPLPSTPTERTAPFAPVIGVNVASTLPSRFNRAMRLRAMPLMVVKSPATITRPSAGWIATAYTGLSAPEPGSNDTSSEPSRFNRAIRPRTTPLMLVNCPPMTVRPSSVGWAELVWIARANTASSGPLPRLVKVVVSTVPSTFRRAMRLRVTPSTPVKLPPIIHLPFTAGAAFWMKATTETAPLGPLVGLNDGLSEPAARSVNSLSTMVSTALWLGAPPGRIEPPAGLMSRRFTSLFPPAIVLSMIGTVTLARVWPGAKNTVLVTGT